MTTKTLFYICLFYGVSQQLFASHDVNAHDENGDTPLTRAIFNKDVLEVKRLLDAGADPYKTKNGDWANAIDFMIWSENREIQRLILNHRDGMVGDTLLVKAVFGQDEYMVKTLLDMGASPMERKSDNSADTIDFAFWGASEEIRRLIFNHQFENKNGNTPLMEAILSENVSAVKRLVAYGADRSLANKSGETAADLAKRSKHIEIQRAVNNEFSEVSVGYIDAFNRLNQLMEIANKTGQKIGKKDYFKISKNKIHGVDPVLSTSKIAKVPGYGDKVNVALLTLRSTEGKLPHELLRWYQYIRFKIVKLRTSMVFVMKICYQEGLSFEIHNDRLTLTKGTLSTLANEAHLAKALSGVLEIFSLDDLIRQEVSSFAEKIQYLQDSEVDFGHRTKISDYNLRRMENLLPAASFRYKYKDSREFRKDQYEKYGKYLKDLASTPDL